MSEALVIGAGLAGLQTAWMLARDGHNVTVLERLDGVGLETSFANGGLLTPSHAAPWNSPGIWRVLLKSIGREDSAILFRPSALPLFWRWGLKFLANSRPERFAATIEANAALAHASMAAMREVTANFDDDFEHLANGTMMIYRSENSLATGIANARRMEAFGVRSNVLRGEAVTSVEPALASAVESIVGGVEFPDDESGNAHLYCRELARICKSGGVNIVMDCSVEALRVEGRRIRAVETNRGDYEPDLVVLAAGVFSPTLAKSVGFDLPIRPVKGYSLTFTVEGWNDAPKVPIVDDDLHVGLTPLGSRLRAVGSAEFTGYDKSVTPQRIDMLKAVAKRIYPTVAPYLEPRAEHVAWAGLRPMTPDCLPIVGPSPYENLYLNTGHSYLGWTTAAGTSSMVADAIAGRSCPIDPKPYSLSRF